METRKKAGVRHGPSLLCLGAERRFGDMVGSEVNSSPRLMSLIGVRRSLPRDGRALATRQTAESRVEVVVVTSKLEELLLDYHNVGFLNDGQLSARYQSDIVTPELLVSLSSGTAT